MKTLLVIRHAKSSWKDPALTDLQRPLKKRGSRNAVEMAERLQALCVAPEQVFCSPANRALQTVEHMAPILDIPQEQVVMASDLYTFDYADLMRYLRTVPDKFARVALVGHNPAITDLVNFLSLEAIRNIPTCGVALLELGIAEWRDLKAGVAQLVHYDFPRNEENDVESG